MLKIPAPSRSESFAYLDDPGFLEEYAFDHGLQMRFYLEGVHCAACVWLTEKLPELVPGVESLSLDLSSSVALVRLREGGSFAAAVEQIARLGYRPHPVSPDGSEELRKQEDRRHLVQLAIAGMVSGNIMLLAVALYAGATGGLAELFRWASLILYLPVAFYSSLPFYRSAWASLRVRRISIDVPIVLGLLVGTAASVANLVTGSAHIYFDSLSALVFLLLSTRYLLRRVNRHAFEATRLIHFLAPARARRLTGAGEEEVRTHALREGDLIRVLPGECFPVDGLVTAGESAVDRALLTGESVPVPARPGSRIEAGTWNRQAPLDVRVTASGARTRLGRILAATERGLAAKAPILSYLDRVGRAFVAAVLVLTAVGFLLGLSVSWHEAVNRALAVAIVVCPCTFAFAAPLAMSLAIGRCARNGVLVKDAEVLERLSQVETVFLDKTGTLTVGGLEVVEWNELEPGTAEALLALELRSCHPIAKAVQKYFADARIRWQPPEVEGFEELPGVGVSGRVHGSRYVARGRADPERSGTSIAIFRNGALVGTMTFSDRLRPDSAAAVARLRGLGLEVRILSGDASRPVQAAAALLGVEPASTAGAVGPEGKARAVRGVPKSLMVGDGANDAVALASAYAGVVVQGGMEASLRAAGAYSSKPGIMPVYWLIVVARETLRVIRRNLAFAVLYNVAGIAVALSGRLDPLFAAVLMPLSALTVFLSTMAGTRVLRASFGAAEREAV